jgi:hypothetical protein
MRSRRFTTQQRASQYLAIMLSLIAARGRITPHAAVPAPVPVAAPAPPPDGGRTLTDACELIEAELDSAAANCWRQSETAATRADAVGSEVAALGGEAGEAAGAARQASANLAAVSAAGGELSAAGREIAAQASRSSVIAQQAVATSDDAARAAAALGEAAQAIGSVVRTIAAIATRTNLLALNATIEAARAGEAGRGFAVVAAEVKALSGQTAAATTEIAARIRTMQDAATGSAAAMKTVAASVRDIEAVNAAVAAAVEEQDATLQDVAARLQTASVNAADVAGIVARIAQRGLAMGALAEAAESARRASDAQADELRGNVALMLRRMARLGADWNAQVPVMTAGRLHAAGWAGPIMVLDLSAAAAMVRVPPEAMRALAENGAVSVEIDAVGSLQGQVAAASHGRIFIMLAPPPSDTVDRLAAFVGAVYDDDRRFIGFVQEGAARIAQAMTEALRDGALTQAALFDTNYQLVAGSDPAQFVTGLTETADRIVRPVLDDIARRDPGIVGALACDWNGYTPTHNTNVSQVQRPGDPAWNAKHCRNRRLFNDRAGLSAARNTAPFLLQSYERDMGGGERMMIKEADAPIMVEGRHWGALRVMFRNRGAA